MRLKCCLLVLRTNFRKKYEFRKRDNEWLKRADVEGIEVQPNDSESQLGASATSNGYRSDISSSSRLSVKIEVAKAEKVTTQLKLHQLQRKLELQKKRDILHRRQEISGRKRS